MGHEGAPHKICSTDGFEPELRIGSMVRNFSSRVYSHENVRTVASVPISALRCHPELQQTRVLPRKSGSKIYGWGYRQKGGIRSRKVNPSYLGVKPVTDLVAHRWLRSQNFGRIQIGPSFVESQLQRVSNSRDIHFNCRPAHAPCQFLG